MEPVRKKKHITPQIAQLMSALQFDAADLETNRLGRLSLRNVNRLWMRLLTGIALIALPWIVVYGMSQASQSDLTRIVALVAGILGLVVLRYAGESIYTCWQDLQANAPNVVEGPVEVLTIRGGEATLPAYVLKIDSESFPVNWDATAIFHNGDNYALYYTPRTRMLLAAEPLDEGVPAPSQADRLSGFVPRLGAIFDFTADDLAANAAGILSDRQVDVVQARLAHNTDIAWRMILWVVGGSIVMYGLFEFLRIGAESGWVYGAALAILAVVLLGTDRLTRYKIGRTVQGRRVAVISGHLLILPPCDDERKARAAWIQIAGQEFGVDPGLRGVLCECQRAPCSAYYVPGTHILLSIAFDQDTEA